MGFVYNRPRCEICLEEVKECERKTARYGVSYIDNVLVCNMHHKQLEWVE